MKTMQAVVLVTCAVSLVSGMLDAIRPDRKFDRQMQLLLSAVFLLAILTPLVKGAGEFRTTLWETEDSTVSDSLSVAAEEQTVQITEQQLEETVTAYLEQGGVFGAEVTASVHTEADGSIEIECVTVRCADPETAQPLLTACLGEEVTWYVEQASETTDSAGEG